MKVKINFNLLDDKKDNLTCCAFLAGISCWASLKYFINIWQCFVFIVIARFLTFFYPVRGRGRVGCSGNDLGHFPFIAKFWKFQWGCGLFGLTGNFVGHMELLKSGKCFSRHHWDLGVGQVTLGGQLFLSHPPLLTLPHPLPHRKILS